MLCLGFFIFALLVSWLSITVSDFVLSWIFCLCVCVWAYMCVHVCLCLCVYVHVHMCVYVCTSHAFSLFLLFILFSFSLCIFLLFLFYLSVLFSKERDKGVWSWIGRETLGGDMIGENKIRIHCMKKCVFSMKNISKAIGIRTIYFA